MLSTIIKLQRENNIFPNRDCVDDQKDNKNSIGTHLNKPICFLCLKDIWLLQICLIDLKSLHIQIQFFNSLLTFQSYNIPTLNISSRNMGILL